MPNALRSRLLTSFLSALSITLSFGLAFAFNLERPFWAGFTAMVISLSTIGQSAQKAVLRISGTIIGSVMGLFLLSLADQQHWLLFSILYCYVIFMILCMVSSQYNSYFFFTSAIVAIIIILGSINNSLTPFQYAVARLEETSLGIAVYSFFALLFWPRSSLDSLVQSLSAMTAMHCELFKAVRAEIDSPGTVFKVSLTQEGLKLIAGIRAMLPAARLESYRVRRQHTEWTALLNCASEILQSETVMAKLIQRFTPDSLHKLFPDLPQRLDFLEQAYTALNDSQARAQPEQNAGEFNPDPLVLHSLAPEMQHAAHGLCHEYERQMELCRALREHILFLASPGEPGTAGETATPRPAPLPVFISGPAHEGRPFLTGIFSPRHLEQALKGTAIYWSALLLWIYLNPPGSTRAMFAELAIVFGLVGVLFGDLPPLRVLASFGAGCLLAGLAYFGLIPWLHGFMELGPLLFLFVFAVTFRWYLPAQGITRTGILIPVFALCDLQNIKTYDPAAFFAGALSLMLCAALVASIFYLFAGAAPERRYYRRQERFFSAVSAYLRSLAQYAASSKGRASGWQRMKSAWHLRQIMDLPPELVDLAFAFRESSHGLAPQSVKETALSTLDLSRQISLLARQIGLLARMKESGEASSKTASETSSEAASEAALSLFQLSLLPGKASDMEEGIRLVREIARALEKRMGTMKVALEANAPLLPGAGTALPTKTEMPPAWRKLYMGLLNALRATLDSAEKVPWTQINIQNF